MTSLSPNEVYIPNILYDSKLVPYNQPHRIAENLILQKLFRISLQVKRFNPMKNYKEEPSMLLSAENESIL